jgi:hypothetical protein
VSILAGEHPAFSLSSNITQMHNMYQGNIIEINNVFGYAIERIGEEGMKGHLC